MSESENPAPRRKLSVLRFVVRLVIGLILLLVAFFFLLLLVGSSGPFTLIITLAFGWLEFLSRTLPKISLNADLIGMAVVCISLILLLAHRFMVWISASVAESRKVSWIWPWKWTWCGLGAVLLLFLVGIGHGRNCPSNWLDCIKLGAMVRNQRERSEQN